MNDIREKIVVITGATKGLGAALARSFARDGAAVAMCARNKEALVQLRSEIEQDGGKAFGLAIDISVPDHAENFARETLKRFGRVDALINNASVLGQRVPVVDYQYKTWRDVIDVNINGTFLVTKAFLPSMMKEQRGSIINLSSGVGAVGKPRWGAYCVSKFGVEGFSYMLAEEMREYGVRVNIVNPGGLATEMRRAAYPDEDQSKLAKPEDIYDVFRYLVSDRSASMTGERINAQDFSVNRS
jgi:NAD(P)-dependent dehydrogenase (short-subunit alcohol dehydrogenase family)